MFRYDPTTLKAADAERGLVLEQVSGGSDGTVYFKLVGASTACEFSAHREADIPGETRASFAVPSSAILSVWVIHNWTEEWKETIREVMLVLERGRIAQATLSGINAGVRQDWARTIAFVKFAGEYFS